MARFKAVTAEDNTIHVGVLDTQNDIVLDLTTEDEVVSQIRTTPKSSRRWRDNPTYSQLGTDEDVRARWNDVVNFWNGLVNSGGTVGYDYAGESALNCECIVSYILENRLEAKLGKVAALLRKVGIDVGSLSRSRSS